jgi:glycosyltransferase involved in cell wall biosynthesis
MLYESGPSAALSGTTASSPATEPVGTALDRPSLLTLGVIVLTFNSANVIERTVRAALEVGDAVFVVDSGSTDGTVSLVSALGCRVIQRPFKNYADQRNWAIDEFGHLSQWQLHLDADEVLDAKAIAEVHRVLTDPSGATAFIFERRTYFMGRPLHFGGATNYHLRLFRSGTVRCEDRLYDQHFVSEHPGVRIGGLLHDMNVGSLSEWTARHNRWSDMEAAELRRNASRTSGQIKARLSSDPRERRRLYKRSYYSAPPILRALLLFFCRYFVQGGFLDGRPGFYYAFFQALWFRMLVDAKLDERSA